MNRKILILTFLFFSFSLYCETSSNNQQNITIIETAGNGGSLINIGTSELQSAGDYARNNGYEREGYVIQSELDRRNAEKKIMEQRAQEAESKAANALGELENAKIELINAEKILETYDKSTADFKNNDFSYKEAVKNVEKARKNVAELKENLENKVAAMHFAYEQLAETAEKYQSTGDPVQISTGEFIANYEDFYAQDFGNILTVKRNFSDNGFCEGFGRNWTCSLSSRIIRSETNNLSEILDKLQENLSRIKRGISICENYESKFSDFPNSQIESFYEEFTELRKKYEFLIEEIQKTDLENLKKQELNKFVKYGRFLDSKNYYSLNDDIIFVTDEGSSLHFYYSGNGLWKSYSALICKKIEIFSIDENKNVVNSQYGNGGFCVKFKDGKKIYYSKYGILSEIEDIYGNKTFFNSENGQINSIKLKTQEILKLKRNSENQIIKISGDVSGEANFSYQNENLISVTDNKNINLKYHYDSENYLIEILKADENKITIKWKTKENSRKKVCISVIDENHNQETFSYDFQNKMLIHKTVNGNSEKFKYNDFGNVIYRLEENGDEIFIENNSLGLITSITKNGVKKNFFYDENFNLVKIEKSDGGKCFREYNGNNQLIKISDFDGFFESYFYDEKGFLLQKYYCGNLVSSCQYYKNGLLKSLSENDCFYNYEYNQFGSLTKKEFLDKDGKKYTEIWTYDEKNRLKKYENLSGESCNFSYANNYKCELFSNGRKIEHFFNNRGFEIKLIETDTNTNISYTKENVYDGKGNILKIFLNGKIFLEYEYLPSGKLNSSIIWNHSENNQTQSEGVKVSYNYDNFGRIVKKEKKLITENYEKSSFVEKNHLEFENSYEKTNSNYIIKNTIAPNYVRIFTYDKNQNLTCEENPNGFVKKITYSKAERILSTLDSNGNLFTYNYNSDGSYSKILKLKTGLSAYFSYDKIGNLIYYKDFVGNIFKWTYNGKNCLLKTEKPTATFLYEYDDFGRIISAIVKDSSGKIIQNEKTVFDKNKITEYSGNYISSIMLCDVWGRILECENSSGIKKYSYDELGLVKSQTDGNNVKTIFEHDALGNVIYENNFYGLEKKYFYDLKNNLVSVSQNNKQIFSLKYDDFGKLLEFEDFFFNKNQYSYDEKGFLSQISNYDTGKFNFTYENEKSHFFVEDSASNQWKIKYSEGGKIEQFTNPLKLTKKYDYSPLGKINSIENFSGTKENYSYEKNQNSVFITKKDDKIKIEKNPLGEILTFEDNFSKMSFEYDFSGKLKKQKDFITNLEIEFLYDDFGRLKTKLSSLFEIEYQYNLCGLISKITEKKSGEYLEFGYDNLYRENQIFSSRGISTFKYYNDDGLTEALIIKDKIGQILFSQFILYDDFRKITAICNNKGEVSLFNYDENGKFISQIVKFSEEIYEKSRKDFILCGGFEENISEKGEIVYLSQNIRNDFQKIFDKINFSVSIPFYQHSWKTEYEYTSTGSVLSETSKFGKIIYEYDKLNRLRKKHVQNTLENGINFFWNDDNCLEKEECIYYKKEYKYNNNFYPIEILVTDFENENSSFIFYDYDVFGRRIFENKNGSQIAYIYDGFSNDFSMKIPIFYNKRANFFVSENFFVEDEYKTLKDETNFNNIKSLEIISSKNENLSPSVFLGLADRDFIIISPNSNSNFSSFFYLYDYKNQTVGFVDNDGKLTNFPQNDVWEKSQFFENREYNSSMKSFTTMDPAFDKGNLFAFCSCDPINYFDKRGLKKTGYTTAETAKFNAKISEYLLFDKNEYLEKGSWNGIEKIFDCMDVSTSINMICEKAAGMEYSSELIRQFASFYEIGDFEGAAGAVRSKDMFDASYADVATKLTPGYDKNALRFFQANFDENTSDYKQFLENEKTNAEQYLSNPQEIHPGTTLVWKKSSYKTKSDSGNWEGHTMTILARSFDAEGNIIGFSYIEGHTGGGKTDVGYMTIKPVYNDDWSLKYDCLDSWNGIFMGAYEFQSTDEHKKGAEKEKKLENSGCIK